MGRPDLKARRDPGALKVRKGLRVREEQRAETEI
jgi:hypothetical protein